MAADPRLILILFLVIFLVFVPDSRNVSPLQLREIDAQVAHERAALQVLNTSDYGALDPARNKWLNITGFQGQGGFLGGLWDQVKVRAKQQQDLLLVRNIQLSNESDKSTTDFTNDTLDLQEALQMYDNVTSFLTGRWVRSRHVESQGVAQLNLSALHPEVMYATQKYRRNITGLNGDVRLKLSEQSIDGYPGIDPQSVRSIKAGLTLKDESSTGDGWDITLYGVHFPAEGSIVVTTTSEKFAGIFALPHFALSQNSFILARKLLNSSLGRTIEEQTSAFAPVTNPWASNPGGAADPLAAVPYCEIIMHLQQHPQERTVLDLSNIEQEMRYPTGATLALPPRLQMTMSIFSPDCGFALESLGPPDFSPHDGQHLSGVKIELYIRTARDLVMIFGFLSTSAIFLLKYQMKEASTPSTKSRISFQTIMIMSLGDGFACMCLLLTALYVDALYVTLVGAAFLSFMCVSFFGMKCMMDVWNVQRSDRQSDQREQQRPQVQRQDGTEARTSAATPSLLPLPVTARWRADGTQIDSLSDQDPSHETTTTAIPTTAAPTTVPNSRREVGAIYSRFYFFLLVLSFLSLHATTWPGILRSTYCNMLVFLYLSMWTPQIYRNVMRNCRKALSWRFVVGQSVIRLMPFVYFYTYDDNILYIKPDIRALLILASWLWLQVFVLASQEAVGPRFAVPEGWAPPAYDYHPILRTIPGDETGFSLPIGFSEAVVPSTLPPVTAIGSGHEGLQPLGQSTRIYDCAICTETFEVPIFQVNPDDTQTVVGVADNDALSSTGTSLARAASTMFSCRMYMITPCRHIFHTTCLEGWLRYRLQCPICRESLPPL